MNKITIISSFYNADVYIDKFLENAANINGYENLCVHMAYNIIGSHKDNEGVSRKLEKFAKKHRNFHVADIHKDPGLYELWNISAKTAKTKYLMTYNIDDRCSPEYVANAMIFLTKYNADLVCAGIKTTRKKNASMDEYDSLWYNKKAIYYDNRFDKQKQLDKANIVKVEHIPTEIMPNKKYKQLSHKIDPKYKESVMVNYNRITLEDMFIDWKCDGYYMPYNIPHCMPIWRTTLHKYGYFEESKVGVCADYEYWLRILKMKPDAMFMFINKPHVLYLEDENSHNRRDANKEYYNRLIEETYLKNIDTKIKLNDIIDSYQDTHMTNINDIYTMLKSDITGDDKILDIPPSLNNPRIETDTLKQNETLTSDTKIIDDISIYNTIFDKKKQVNEEIDSSITTINAQDIDITTHMSKQNKAKDNELNANYIKLLKFRIKMLEETNKVLKNQLNSLIKKFMVVDN